MNPHRIGSRRAAMAAPLVLLACGALGCVASSAVDTSSDGSGDAALAYDGASIFGIHYYPAPGSPPPAWLGGGARRVWVTEVAAGADSWDWFHWNGTCPGNTTCGSFAQIAAQNTEIIARIDYRRGGQDASVPTDAAGLADFEALARDRLFASTDDTPITRYARTILVGNEINLCSENGLPGSCNVAAPAQRWTDPAWYATVYRGMRSAIHGAAAATSHPDVNVMIEGSSPEGYGGERYVGYVLGELCHDDVDAIALHAYGWMNDPGADGTFGLSSQIDAQLRAIDDACDGRFRNVPVVVTEFSRGTRVLPDSDFIAKTYTWIHDWNADANHHGIAGATYFVGRGADWPEENVTMDAPVDHTQSRAAFQAVTANDWRARVGGSPSGPLPKDNECSTGGSEQTFPETGYTVSGSFADFWSANGGLPVFGYPISNARVETNTSGVTACAQWFERQRLELAPSGVVLGLLGDARAGEDYQQMVSQHALDPRGSAPSGCTYFPETHHTLCGGFQSYWQSHGLVVGGPTMLFGYPVSEEFAYRTSSGTTVTAQYFERARLEWHPENAPPYDILQGRLGAELLLNQR